MVPDRQLDVRPVQHDEMEHERLLLTHDAEQLRAFYALSGPARKNYTEQMAEAEARRIRLLREAQADGLVAMRRAEAEGYRLIGQALAALPNAEHVLEIARLHTVQRVADYLADGKASKIFLPPDLKSIFSFLDIGGEAKGNLQKHDERELAPAPIRPAP